MVSDGIDPSVRSTFFSLPRAVGFNQDGKPLQHFLYTNNRFLFYACLAFDVYHAFPSIYPDSVLSGALTRNSRVMCYRLRRSSVNGIA